MHFRLLTAALILSASSTCFADTFVTFELNSTYSPYSGTANGTVVIDVTTGQFGIANITGTEDGVPITFTGDPFQQNNYPANSDYPNQSAAFYTGTAVNSTVALYSLSLDVPVPDGSLVGYVGGPLCTTSYGQCHAYVVDTVSGTIDAPNGVDSALTGSLTPISSYTTYAPTPEPSGFALLGTGLLGLTAAVKRRFV